MELDPEDIKYCLVCKDEITFIEGKKEYCSPQCYAKDKQKFFIDSWLSGEKTTFEVADLRRIKRYLIEINGEKCSTCSWNQRNPITTKVPIELDHIDGNHENNKLDNLRLLCPNCHSLTSTYRALNLGRGRKNRRKNRL